LKKIFCINYKTMPRSFKLKPYSHKKKVTKVEEYKPLESPYVKEKCKIVRPVYFDFYNYDEPPKVQFIMEPCPLFD